MFIEELVVDGFKSYSTRTSVGPFDKQFNAITGLNGSGKSNILDSICFVLGISNLSQVRVGNLSELVYKQGQAGVTKASVTVVFNNLDKSCSPVGYEMHDRITITRQIVIGGRNRYLLNSHNVQQNQIQNLFHSVQLNVNNPHFLIMQGRITKVINMKPVETLGMIEEAAGTRMYENKKQGAVRTLEKKQGKVDEINRLMAEEITPTLEKLQKERANYMLWVSNNNEIERLTRFCIAYEYVQVQHRLDNKTSVLEELEASLKQITEDLKANAQRETAAQQEIKQRTASRDKQRSTALKQLDDEHSKLSKELVAIESKVQNRQTDLQGQLEGRQQFYEQLEEQRKIVAAKDEKYQKEKVKFDGLEADETSHRQEIERAQWTMQALSAGVSAKEGPKEGDEAPAQSLREQLLQTQTRISEMEAEKKQKGLAVEHLTGLVTSTEQTIGKSKQDFARLSKERSAVQKLVGQLTERLEKLHFDPEQYGALEAAYRQGATNVQALWEKIEALRAHVGGLNFQYSDPWKNFDRSKVSGVVASLFNINSEHVDYSRALEVCAGGRLFFVVVDDEETGKALLEKGQLRRRVTIIPLNKIVDPTLRPAKVQEAQSVVPDGVCNLALSIIGYEREVESAMKYVFGGMLVCDSPETAKKVTFHPNVRARSVTKQGDLYDPAGTITGGSMPRGGGILTKLQELSGLERRAEAEQQEVQKLKAQLEQLRGSAGQYQTVERELKCQEHELSLVEDRIQRSEHYAAEQELQQMRAQLEKHQDDVAKMPEEKKRLEKLGKQLEKDVKSLESGREERIGQLERQVEQLKEASKKKAEKVQQQREKTEQVTAEVEVAKAELDALMGKEQDWQKSQGAMGTEVKDLESVYEKGKVKLDEVASRLEALQGEIKELDQALGSLAAEVATLKAQKDEKELEQKRLGHKIAQMHKEDKEASGAVQRLTKAHPWVEREAPFFGKPGTDFDFEKNDYQENKDRLGQLAGQQSKLSKNINKKAMAMFEKAEQEYRDLLQKRDIILNDKKKIEQVIMDLDLKKGETLRRTWEKVTKDFGSIFSTLLPGTNAKLQIPEGMTTELEGLEIKVAFNDVWKQSLTELSGGQRSLLALSLVLALLLFKPAPMYILDEIDSALDLSHTQNIGHMIRSHFPHSQFIIVSLKEGMFNNANVLFRTRFIDGTSTVARYAMRDGHAPAPEDAAAAAKAADEEEAKATGRKRKAGA